MKKISKLYSGFIWMFIASMAMLSCTDEDNWENKVEEGLPVGISFSITTPAPNEVETRATDEQETKIEKLALFFYKDDNSKPFAYQPTVGEPIKDQNPSSGQSSTNYLYNIEVPMSSGLTSGTWKLYAVANWDKGFWDNTITFDQLANMTLAQMKDFCIKKKNRTLNITETAVLLSGKYGQEQGDGKVVLESTPENKGMVTLSEKIHLKRSFAKIIFNFKKGPGVKEFTPLTYEIHNYCRTSTLFERDGWNYADPNGLKWKGVTADDNFSEGSGLTIDKNQIIFYMPENIQYAKKTLSKEQRGMREKRGADGSFENAPENATYIVVHGTYNGPISQQETKNVIGEVHYTILLGDFSNTDHGNVNNYSTRRNTKYTYNVTVNGVNNIYVEATTDVENQPGAEGDLVFNGDNTVKPEILDSHYETCILAIPLNRIEQRDKFGLILKTPYSDFTTQQIKEGDLTNLDLNWVEFCKPASSQQWVKYPGQGSKDLMNLVQLLHAFYAVDKNNPETYNKNFVVEGDYLYVQAFVNEYFYDKDPITGGAADLNKFINADSRMFTLASSTAISNDGKSSYTGQPLFAIQQKSIKSMYDMSVGNPFGIETFEDDKVAVQIAPNTNDTYQGSDKDDGHKNYFANFPKSGDGKVHWSTFVDYKTNKLKPEYNYGIYQGLLRNRDLNNNDILDPEEMKWFIPSVNQHIAIWNGYHALDNEVRLNKGNLYYTSTNGQFRTMWAKEGAFGAYKTGDEGGKELVRCIRALKDIDGKTTRSSVFNPETNTFNVSGFMHNAIRQSGSQQGEYNYHSQNATENKLPEAFQMAKQNLTATIGAVPDKPGNTHAPEVSIKDKSGYNSGNHTQTFTVTITNFSNGHKYYKGTTSSFAEATLINEASFAGTVKGYESKAEQDLYIFSDNGNYVKIHHTGSWGFFSGWSYNVVADTPVIIPANQPVPGKPGRTTSKFTVDEISTMNICENYSELPDGSDKGQWRIPNQRELMIMFMFSQNAGDANSKYRLSETTATRTYYDARGEKDGMFFIQLGGGFITTQNDKNIQEFVVRPVRDVQRESTAIYDSGFEPGYSIIK